MVREFVIKWFVENGTLNKTELLELEDKNYLEEGIVDSFGFLRLITSCEEELKIAFSDEDFSNDEIFTLKGIINIIERKTIA